MLGSCNLVAFTATTDGVRSRGFYEGLLGLRVVSDDPFALVLDANGTELRVTKLREFRPHSHTVLGWAVADIEAEVDALVSAGVAFQRYAGMEQDARGIWTSPAGARIAWFLDPDGNVLSLQGS